MPTLIDLYRFNMTIITRFIQHYIVISILYTISYDIGSPTRVVYGVHSAATYTIVSKDRFDPIQWIYSLGAYIHVPSIKASE